MEQLRGTILQPWNYYSPILDSSGKNLWQRLKRDAQKIKHEGYTAIWLPPSGLAMNGTNDVGYGIKDWRELNGTKYGNEQQLAEACRALSSEGINIYHDQVHNHLMGGEDEHNVWCLSVKMNNKNEPVNEHCVWFQTTIPTAFPWLNINHHHFDAFHPNDYECWILANKSFEKEAYQDPWGGCDLDFDNIDLVFRLEEFGYWYKNRVHVDGYRFDAVKHIRPKGTLNFLTAMRVSESKNMFAVGEFLHDNIRLLHEYIVETLGQISLFDVPLQRKLSAASKQGNYFDMGSLHSGTLTKDQPALSVSYVHSHDDQPAIHHHDARNHNVEDWFISQAYAIILLRDEGYPIVFDADTLRHPDMIKRYMLLRNNCTYGYREDHFDHHNTVGWSFHGGNGYDNSMAVIITNGHYGKKWLPTGKPYTTYRDFTDALQHVIMTNENGWAEFQCPERNTSAWVEESKYHSLKNALNLL